MHARPHPVIDCHVHVFDPARFAYAADAFHRSAGGEIATAAQLGHVLDAHGIWSGPPTGHACARRRASTTRRCRRCSSSSDERRRQAIVPRVDGFLSGPAAIFAASLCRFRSNGVVAIRTRSIPMRGNAGDGRWVPRPSTTAPRAARPISMFATLLGSITSRHRAWAFGLLWLLALTILNVQTGGAYRSTVLFAVPVVVVAWTDCRLGFVFAALSVIAARFGGAMPEPGATSPLWADAMLAFIKLSIDAVVVNAWGRRRRRRAGQGHESEDLPRQGGN